MGRGFALCGHAVMALRAVSGYTGMIKCCAGKTSSVMATVTLRGGRNVGRWLPNRDDAVVTRRTHAKNLSVIHTHRRP